MAEHVDDATAAERPLPSDLDIRKALILRAVVAEYVSSAEPVGSKRVVDAARLDISAATVRNEMSALEDAGYIVQPHTSAGRVPTDKGYRFFVDDLQAAAPPSQQQREVMHELLGNANDLEELLRRATHVLSRVTSLVSLVVAPAFDRSRLKLVELVSLTTQTVLVLLVTDTGRVEKRMIELRSPLAEAEVERVRSAINKVASGHLLRDIGQEIGDLVDTSPKELRDLTRAVADTARDIEQPAVDRIFVGGQATLAGVDVLERDQLSRILELLEERMTIARVISSSPDDETPLVRIGGENEVEDLHATSLVTQRYRLSTGSVGVLGPTRMDYAAVLATVRAVAEALHDALADLNEDAPSG